MANKKSEDESMYHKHKQKEKVEPLHQKGKHKHGGKGKGRIEDHFDEMVEKGPHYLRGQ